jgi:acyl carrier protein
LLSGIELAAETHDLIVERQLLLMFAAPTLIERDGFPLEQGSSWSAGTIPLPQSRPIALRKLRLATNEPGMSDRQQTYAKVAQLIEPFNKKGVSITEATRFAQDLEWDSLTVLDFVANIEDEFDVIISMNMQAEIETVGQLVDTLERLKAQ